MTTQEQQDQPAVEETNPLIAEADQMNDAGDAGDILAGIAQLDQKEAAEETAESPEDTPTPQETPAPEATPAETPAAVEPPAPSPAMKQQLEEAQAQLRVYDEQAHQQNQTNQVAQYKQQLINQGHLEENAQVISDQYGVMLRQVTQMQRDSTAREQNREGKVIAAMQYSQKYGVHYTELMQYDTPESMEAAAKQQQKITNLESQVSRLTKNTVPAQEFASTAQAPVAANGDNAMVDRYNNGDRSEAVLAVVRKQM